MRRYLLYSFLCAGFAISSPPAGADIISVAPDEEQLSETALAKVFFVGEVTERKVAELVSVLDRLNSEHKALQSIYLYINSPGGDMDSAQAAYWAIKSSPIPVIAVNISTVASVAAVMFCGAAERAAFPNTYFILKPASVTLPEMSMQPVHFELSRELLKSYNEVFESVYRECTSLSADEISAVIESEDNRLLVRASEAREKGIISSEMREIVVSPLSYTILDREDLDVRFRSRD
ncbi:Clp protease ClpP [Chelativorans multitrophicus]|jgi:ATP-dependent Clp protease protease subunit|uniref:ATP-dependent Clp protease proteolytic subunit n=1 Tax=Chelativorans sp. (strain BNC1) TaxID=266779 RepID=Q11IP3_CHESB|nr:Clp protease ClpP [Chelativorans multitrophicus]